MAKAQLRPIYPSEFQQPQLQPSRSNSVGRTSTGCPIAPIGCTLNCPHGFAWGVPGGSCLCICQLDPCFSTICGLGEVCVSNKDSTKCVSLVPRRESTSANTARPNASGRNSSNSDSTIGECPRLLGGLCVNRCRTDSECESSQKCCYNGCGHECVQPVNVAPIRGSLLIQPLLGQPAAAAGRSESPEVRRPVIQPALTSASARPISGTSFLPSGSKPGQCPSATSLKDKRCGVECNRDDDCKGVSKCCANGCGRICAPPEKSTACVHLLSAVERLPQRILINGFVPSCSSSGHFNPVQCDSEFCWCVDPESGHEIFGTKLQRAERASLNCREPRYCALSECMATCPFGVQTDDRGCPLEGCICKDTCQSVKCEHKFDQCQLVEPDCSKPPCSPVPRCFLNPCPSGSPMSLTNGVTALCQQSAQCWDGFWCHQVGYNGLGFCCPVPESATRPGLCPSKAVQSNHRISSQDCSSECKVDADCASPAKCCFDGCGLKCTLPVSVDLPSEKRKDTSNVKQERPNWDAERNNKRVIAESPKLALCPAILNNAVSAENGEECIAECRKNEDCLGLRKCCAVGCSRLCVYPQTTTECLHQAITHEIYKLKRSPLKCNSEGDFEEIQCNDEYCYCVHTKTGVEKPNGRVPLNRQPNCGNTISCAIPQCTNRCPHGYAVDEEGCESCKCQNKCDGIRCERGQICVIADVDCLEGSKCSAQPRCIENICQSGSPFVAAHRFVEQCHKECPVGFWCNKIGLPGAGGLCCPVNSRSQESELSSAIALVSQQHRGECVRKNVDVNRKECRLRTSPMCRLDSDCSSNEKCCFDGCDTSCVPIISGPDSTFPTPPPNGIQVGREDTDHNKIGVCPALSKSQRSDCRSGTDQCSSDSDCPTILKCCSDGCYKRCVYAQRNTPCLHLKAASELLDIKRAVQCSKDGNFEDIQCNNEYCWCVEAFSGYEIQGTRVSSTRTPECEAPQQCPDTYCNSPKRCPYGYEKDSNGCNTCECVNPCKDVECPNPDRICLPEPVDCLNTKGHCTYHVPKCVVNVCIVREALLLRESTRRPEFCKRSSDCPEANHCRLVNNDNGFCCYGPEPRTNSGKCPRVPEWALIQPADPILCELRCTQDGDCEKSNQKCCFNGCGLACTHTTQHSDEQTVETGSHRLTTSHHKITNAATQSSKKIGQCAKVEPLTSAELCKGSPKDICSEDSECPGNRLCCFDGCVRSCLYPEITTNCLHAQAAADVIARLAPSNIFQPLCTKDGSFERIQRHSGMAWCVDSNGNEIYGTKTMSTLLSDCDALKKKSCPIAPCQKNCRFGYVTDLSGCQQCICKDPCIDAKCPMNTICRMTPVQCLNNATNCTPVAKCILNVCIRGEPLEGANRELITCDEQKGPKCPNGWYCNKFGLENHGYCCAGLVPLTQLQQSAQQCPYMPIMFGHDSRPANVKCRFSEECALNEPCCFNGLGTSCFPAPKDSSRERHLTRTPNRSAPKSVGVISSSSTRAASQCPANVGFINPGCTQECATDEDCHLKSQFMKCCDYSCGRRCIFSNQLTACVHLQAAHIREADKMANIPTSLGRPTVLCSPEGRFMRVQCDVSIKECWCVDPNSGIEVIGTRYSSLTNIEPNCQFPRTCRVTCPTAQDLGCKHGIRLDSDGCPFNGVCECKDVCDDFKCTHSAEICVPHKVQCIGVPCPPVPLCVLNPCGVLISSTLRPTKLATCSEDDDCGNQMECRTTSAENDRQVHVGVCCAQGDITLVQHHPGAVASVKIGRCPAGHPLEQQSTNCVSECDSDGECPGSTKCCQAGCRRTCLQTLNSTNCANMVTALQQLRLQQIPTSLSAPLCDARIGTYLSNQCDQEANCWCVDKITGRPVLGTRKPQPITDVCMNRRTCPIECDNSQIEACPFGIEMDADGCPRTSQCLCKTPCDQIQCPHGQSCIMRHRECQEEICLPVPVCEPNPCANNQKPAVDSRSLSHLMCHENNMELCPGGFHCTAFDENTMGVCCPGKDPTLSAQQTLCISSGVSLPLLSSFPANSCSISEQKMCSHTHYCATREGHSRGTCCPNKRHVCDLPKKEGSCTQATLRFYYDSVSESCLQFLYTGCDGNLNNFLSLNDCQKFCAGTSMDPIRALVNDDGTLMMDLYDVGFAMVGPLARAEKHDADFNSVLREYLMDNFNLQDHEIRDLYVKDDNTVRFTVIAPDAKEKANNISDAVVAGKFHLTYKGDTYRAEPQTLFSHQTSPNTSLSDSATVFWLVLTASILFAVIVIIVLCCGYNFLRLRNATENTNSIYREVSPAPYGQIAAYLQHQQQRISPNIRHSSDYGHINVKAVSADDLNAIRRNASVIATGTHHMALPAVPNGHISITNSLPQTNNGRSIRTVYY